MPIVGCRLGTGPIFEGKILSLGQVLHMGTGPAAAASRDRMQPPKPPPALKPGSPRLPPHAAMVPLSVARARQRGVKNPRRPSMLGSSSWGKSPARIRSDSACAATSKAPPVTSNSSAPEVVSRCWTWVRTSEAVP